MNETVEIFIVLALGFILTVIVLRFYPFKVSTVSNEFPMYYVFDLAERKVTTATLPSLNNDLNKLFNENYELIKMVSLKEFMKYGTELPEHSILIAKDESCIYTILKAFPFLTKEKISIKIFIPISLLNNNKYQEIQTALNQFIFTKN